MTTCEIILSISFLLFGVFLIGLHLVVDVCELRKESDMSRIVKITSYGLFESIKIARQRMINGRWKTVAKVPMSGVRDIEDAKSWLNQVERTNKEFKC
jgi:hypothetical protein